MQKPQIHILQSGEEKLATELANLFYDHPLDSTKAQQLLNSENSFLLCGKIEDEIIGFCFFHLLPRWYDQEVELFFYDLEVLPAHRRKGYGRHLFEAVIDFAKARKIAEIWLLTEESYQEAIPFYRALGGKIDPALLVSFDCSK